MKSLTTAFATVFTLLAGNAFALSAQDVINNLSQQGYTHIEVRVGPTQIKAEGVRGSQKVEIIFDSATGTVLKTETASVESDDDIAPGVSVRERSRDFVRVVRRSSDDSADDSADDDHNSQNHRSSGESESESESEDDHDHSGRGGHDSSDDSDDDSDDDHSGHGGGDDDDDN